MADNVLNSSRVTASKYSPDFSYANQVSGDTFGSLAGYPEFPSAQSFQSSNTGNGFNFGSGILSGLLGGATSILNTIIQNRSNEKYAQDQRVWNEKMYERQRDDNIALWNMENEYNTPVNQVARLREAGLNPLYNSLDGNSAGAVASAQPLGYERANMGPIDNPITTGLQARAAAKEIELKNAQIDQVKSQTEGTDLDNEWKDRTMDARVQAQNLENQIKQGQIKINTETIKKIIAETKKLEEEAKTEAERQALIVAQRILAEAEKAKTDEDRNRIVTLLPYEVLNMKADTQARKAQAAASFVHAAYEQHLIDAGYPDKLADQAFNQSEYYKELKANVSVQRQLADYKLALRQGRAFTPEPVEGVPRSKWDMFWTDVFNYTTQFVTVLGDVIDPIGKSVGIVTGAAALGSKSAPPAVDSPASHGSYTVLYGPDGTSVSRNSW